MTELAHALLLPPGLFFILLALGCIGLSLWPRSGRACLLAGTALLYLLSIAPVAELLVRSLEDAVPPLSGRVAAGAEQAIVVLGAGRNQGAPEYGGRDTVGEDGLVRLRYAAHLRQSTGLPLLLSGGRPRGEARAEAELMAAALRESFGQEARWLEVSGPNTFAGAVCSQLLLEAAGIERIFLVTHAVHMPRARLAFETVGMQVTPAPTGYLREGLQRLAATRRWWPGFEALQLSYTALHEWLGLLYYELLYTRDSTVAALRGDC